MLEKVRKPGRAKNLFAYFIFGAICLVFVFFGIGPGSMGGLGGGGTAAIVNNQVVSIADFQESFKRIENVYSEQLNGVPAAQRQQFLQRLRTQALEDLINREVIAQAAESVGVLIPDIEIRENLLNIPFFQEDGRFQRTRYNAYLQAVRLSSSEFEGKLRKDLALNRLRELFVKSLEPLPGEMAKEDEVQSTQINIEFVKFDKESILSSGHTSAADLKSYLKDEKNQQRVKEYYEANQVEFTEFEKARARHILIRFNEGESEKEALAKIAEIQKRIQKEGFVKLAKETSEDPGSKVKGGDLGYFGRGQMTKAFEDAVFSAQKGEIVGPVRTEFGYHLIKVEDIQAGGLKPLAEVQEKIARNLLAQDTFAKAQEKVKSALAEKNFATVQSELKALGLKWQETGKFNLAQGYIPKLGEHDAILQKTLALNAPGTWLNELVKHQGSDYIFRLKQISKSKPSEKANPAGLSSNQYLAARRANDAFTTWATEEKKEAQIERNSTLFAN